MGDFEDVFGVGVDAVDIIDGFSREFERASARERANWYGNATKEELEAADYEDELSTWRQSMMERGYTKGPAFSSYAELSAWDSENTRPHVRRRNGNGFEVFFTDRRPSGPSLAGDPATFDDEIPF